MSIPRKIIYFDGDCPMCRAFTDTVTDSKKSTAFPPAKFFGDRVGEAQYSCADLNTL